MMTMKIDTLIFMIMVTDVLFLSVISDKQICGIRWCTSSPNKLIFPLSQKYLETDSQTQAPLLDVQMIWLGNKLQTLPQT